MDSLAKRVLARRQHLKLTQTSLAKLSGLKQPDISKIELGTIKKTTELLGLAHALQCNPDWLKSGKGPVEQSSRMKMFPGTDVAIMVPLLTNGGSMGFGADDQDGDVVVGDLALSPKWVSDTLHPSKPTNMRFIHGYGDSMTPTFNSGDVLLVDTGISDARIDGIYVLKAHDRLFIKRVRQRLDGTYEISSDNPVHKTVDTLNGGHDVTILGRVLWAWNGKKL